MRKLSVYILKEFLSFLVYSLLAFTVISILIDLVENIDSFIDRGTGILLIILYYVFDLPFTIVLTFPV